MEDRRKLAAVTFGLGMGAVITAFFGFGWLGWDLGALPRQFAAVWSAYDALGIALLVLATRIVRRGRAMMRTEGLSRADYWAGRGKSFRIVTR